ncbi:MAG: hypothetical protein AAF591_06965 [Verrucomicrobiota bacterium]
MSFEFKVYPEENLIRMRCEGAFTFEELIAHTERVNADPEFRPGMNTLGDYREASLAGEISGMSDYVDHTVKLGEVRGSCKWAVIVPDESFTDVIRMYDLVSRQRGVDIETRAFCEEDEALAWLKEEE